MKGGRGKTCKSNTRLDLVVNGWMKWNSTLGIHTLDGASTIVAIYRPGSQPTGTSFFEVAGTTENLLGARNNNRMHWYAQTSTPRRYFYVIHPSVRPYGHSCTRWHSRHDHGIKRMSIWWHRGRRLWSVLSHAGIMNEPSTWHLHLLPLLQHGLLADHGNLSKRRTKSWSLKSSLLCNPGLPRLGHRSSYRTAQQCYYGPVRRDGNDRDTTKAVACHVYPMCPATDRSWISQTFQDIENDR